MRKPNHRKLAMQLDRDAGNPRHRPYHRAKLQRAAERERELALQQEDQDYLTGGSLARYYSSRFR